MMQNFCMHASNQYRSVTKANTGEDKAEGEIHTVVVCTENLCRIHLAVGPPG